jgi:hypothetical protein
MVTDRAITTPHSVEREGEAMRVKHHLLTVLLGAVGLLSVVSAANARSTVAAADCTISGHADADVSWMDVQRDARYTFNSLIITCSGAFTQTTGTIVSASVGVVSLQTMSNGTFTNIVCGTGTAGDGAPYVTPPTELAIIGTPGLAASILANTNLSYNIVFAGGQGALTWSQTPNTFLPGTPNTAIPDNSTSGKYIPVGGGAIDISPDWAGSGGIGPAGTGPPTLPPPVGAASGLCTHGFTVLGDVGLAIVAPNK